MISNLWLTLLAWAFWLSRFTKFVTFLPSRNVTSLSLTPTRGSTFLSFIFELYKYQAESERKRIIERQQQGIALAKQQGKYHGRKPQYAKDDPRLQHAFKLYQAGMSDVDVARNTGIKRTTFIRYRKKFNIKRYGT